MDIQRRELGAVEGGETGGDVLSKKRLYFQQQQNKLKQSGGMRTHTFDTVSSSLEEKESKHLMFLSTFE